jgi:hypothetical protein
LKFEIPEASGKELLVAPEKQLQKNNEPSTRDYNADPTPRLSTISLNEAAEFEPAAATPTVCRLLFVLLRHNRPLCGKRGSDGAQQKRSRDLIFYQIVLDAAGGNGSLGFLPRITGQHHDRYIRGDFTHPSVAFRSRAFGQPEIEKHNVYAAF